MIDESESGASRGDAQSAVLGMAMAEAARDASATEDARAFLREQTDFGAAIVIGIAAALWDASRTEGLVIDSFAVPSAYSQAESVVADEMTQIHG